MRFGCVELAPIRTWDLDGNLKVLVAASQVLDYLPKVTKENLVVVPDAIRKTAEESIEVAANLVAVAQGCRRQIASPTPCVVLVATGDDARAWLADRSDLLRGEPRRAMSTREAMDLDESALNALRDRADGVALLVEAMSHDHAMGRFHEFIRLFERAFRGPSEDARARRGDVRRSAFWPHERGGRHLVREVPGSRDACGCAE